MLTEQADRTNVGVLGFAEEARAFLEEALPQRSATSFIWGQGDDAVPIVEERTPEEDSAELRRSKQWVARRYDAGFGWICGPVELGGRGLGAAHLRAYRQLEAGFQTPDMSYFTVGLGMVAPTITAHGSPDAQAAYLPGLHRGDLVACQLFSEPDAGSDLAALSTTAVRDGDEWVLKGQKVWTSNAHLADLGEILCRTDLNAPKHRGITGFIVDMGSPGIEVRPLRQMTGGAGFNQVYLHEVRVPDANRLGAENSGWEVAMTTLANERAAIGSGMGLGRGPGPFERLIALTQHYGVNHDPITRDELVQLYIAYRIAPWTLKRALDKAGGAPGPELSILKLAGSRHLVRMSAFVGRVLGPRLTADTGEWGTFAWSKLVCGVPGARLGGGSDEVLRNVIGERILGLAKDVGTDPRTPFREIPRQAV